MSALRLGLLAAVLGATVAGGARASVARRHGTSAQVKQARVVDIAPEPPPDDRDHDRIVRMQTALREILHESILRRTRVGMRVIEARTGRLFFETRGGVLMDPASNQKVLATTTALMRLGADWRFRTELSGVAPTGDGVINGDVYLRGSGDPTVSSGDLGAMAAELARHGVRSIAGAVVADPRRLGADEPIIDDESDADETGTTEDTTPGKLSPRAPLVVDHGLMQVRVRPAAETGVAAEVTTTPSDPSFVVHNTARTKGHGRSRVTVRLSVVGARIQIDVDGRIGVDRNGIVFRRRVPHQALYAAALMRAALASAGIAVRDEARVEPTPPPHAGHVRPLLALHESAPLAVLMRKINKDSENDYAERVLEAAGAEVYGGAPTGDKGVRLLREVIGELGLPPNSYVPRNGSGLGHANRITADAMAALLRSLYLDPRVGPELLQSLSVGGVDGTTRNRFKGTLAAERVRAKTGTLAGKSCLSGLVGDGPDVLAFSILVEGLRGRSLAAVRGAQVTCVNAMMRYVREARGAVAAPAQQGPVSSATAAVDVESGQEVTEGEEEAPPAIAPAAPASGLTPAALHPTAPPPGLPRVIPAAPH
ncbi:MAG TPA: D-alanyl-D-alanine carboxypeptidase/D-alanyl-D-alanine-endopeptidase [Polyangia bacterium]|nr:D-alanyl-D-alanine carboxypeptidase/D-alanyl-D-alanine-endopeptidase [Polyangia bacterium]